MNLYYEDIEIQIYFDCPNCGKLRSIYVWGHSTEGFECECGMKFSMDWNIGLEAPQGKELKDMKFWAKESEEE